jgi:hypothetical protein
LAKDVRSILEDKPIYRPSSVTPMALPPQPSTAGPINTQPSPSKNNLVNLALLAKRSHARINAEKSNGNNVNSNGMIGVSHVNEIDHAKDDDTDDDLPNLIPDEDSEDDLPSLIPDDDDDDDHLGFPFPPKLTAVPPRPNLKSLTAVPPKMSISSSTRVKSSMPESFQFNVSS